MRQNPRTTFPVGSVTRRPGDVCSSGQVRGLRWRPRYRAARHRSIRAVRGLLRRLLTMPPAIPAAKAMAVFMNLAGAWPWFDRSRLSAEAGTSVRAGRPVLVRRVLEAGSGRGVASGAGAAGAGGGGAGLARVLGLGGLGPGLPFGGGLLSGGLGTGGVFQGCDPGREPVAQGQLVVDGAQAGGGLSADDVGGLRAGAAPGGQVAGGGGGGPGPVAVSAVGPRGAVAGPAGGPGGPAV